MAGGAVLISWIGQIVRRRRILRAVQTPSEIRKSVVAFQAQRERYGSLQQTRVSRTMRAVAGLAAIHAHGGMLVDEWTALINVALQARLFVASGLIDHTRPGCHIPG